MPSIAPAPAPPVPPHIYTSLHPPPPPPPSHRNHSNRTHVTFRISLPTSFPPPKSISVLGSWDTFHRPLPLEQDIRVSRSVWKGIYNREGGLEMGQEFEYYFLINSTQSVPDPATPDELVRLSKVCGKLVSLLWVPILIPESGGWGKGGAEGKRDVDTISPIPTSPLQLQQPNQQKQREASGRADPKQRRHTPRNLSVPPAAIRPSVISLVIPTPPPRPPTTEPPSPAAAKNSFRGRLRLRKSTATISTPTRRSVMGIFGSSSSSSHVNLGGTSSAIVTEDSSEVRQSSRSRDRRSISAKEQQLNSRSGIGMGKRWRAFSWSRGGAKVEVEEDSRNPIQNTQMKLDPLISTLPEVASKIMTPEIPPVPPLPTTLRHVHAANPPEVDIWDIAGYIRSSISQPHPLQQPPPIPQPSLPSSIRIPPYPTPNPQPSSHFSHRQSQKPKQPRSATGLRMRNRTYVSALVNFSDSETDDDEDEEMDLDYPGGTYIRPIIPDPMPEPERMEEEEEEEGGGSSPPEMMFDVDDDNTSVEDPIDRIDRMEGVERGLESGEPKYWNFDEVGGIVAEGVGVDRVGMGMKMDLGELRERVREEREGWKGLVEELGYLGELGDP